MTNVLPMKLWVWRHIELRVPSDWELLQFSKTQDQGRCAFSDRHGFRLELSWRAVSGPPDLERMVSDYMAALEKDGMKECARRSHADWQGGEGIADGQRMTRYGGFLAAESCVVEVVFLWPESRMAGLEAAVLDSIRACPPTSSGCRLWAAFGMRMVTPAEVILETASILPAHAELRFAGKRAGNRLVFSRRGMVKEWLRTTPGEWLARCVQDEGAGEGMLEQREVGGHRIAVWRGRARRPGLLRSAVPLIAEAWTCPVDGRLYSWLASGPPSEVGERWLTCCATL